MGIQHEGNEGALLGGLRGKSERQPFCAVVATKDRLSVAGSPDLLASLLPIHSPSSALPWVWPVSLAGGAVYGERIAAPSVPR